MPPDATRRIQGVLWRTHRRPQPLPSPEGAPNLPWDKLDFSERTLHEHLEHSHDAASCRRPEIQRQVSWL